MERPVSLIRRLLILEELERYLSNEIVTIKREIREGGLRIIERRDSPQDIWIRYQNGSEFDEAIFMRKMLDAESKGRVKRTGMMTSLHG